MIIRSRWTGRDLTAPVDAASTWQVCCSVERVYVSQSAKEQFEAFVTEEAARWAR